MDIYERYELSFHLSLGQQTVIADRQPRKDDQRARTISDKHKKHPFLTHAKVPKCHREHYHNPQT